MGAEEYQFGAPRKRTLIAGIYIGEVTSNPIFCTKCHRELPPKELFCLDCFGKYPERKPRPKRVMPDDPGNMFEGL